MKLKTDITINGRLHPKGSPVPWKFIYPFFLIHMLMFGASGFFIAYGSAEASLLFLYLHGGIAIVVYTIFYLGIFGLDEVKWMFINAALGILGITSQIDWILSLFGKEVSNYPWQVHVIPFLYFVLYTFLLRQLVVDLTHSRENQDRQRIVEYLYIAFLLVFYLFF